MLGSGYTGARTDTTQQSGQTPDKKVDINHLPVYVSGYTEMIRRECYLPTKVDCLAPTEWGFFFFEPTVYLDTFCSVHRIRVLL